MGVKTTSWLLCGVQGQRSCLSLPGHRFPLMMWLWKPELRGEWEDSTVGLWPTHVFENARVVSLTRAVLITALDLLWAEDLGDLDGCHKSNWCPAWMLGVWLILSFFLASPQHVHALILSMLADIPHELLLYHLCLILSIFSCLFLLFPCRV